MSAEDDILSFEEQLAALIRKAVESACAYDASAEERMAHVIGYMCGRAGDVDAPALFAALNVRE